MIIKADCITITEIQIQEIPCMHSKNSLTEPGMLISVELGLAADGIEFSVKYRPKTTIELSELVEKFKIGTRLTEINL